MSNSEVKEFKVKKLPKNLQPSSLYYVKAESNKFKIYLTDSKCPPTAYSLDSGDLVKIITSPNGSIQVVDTATETQIQIETSLLAKIDLALQAGDNVSELLNDAGYITTADIPEFEQNNFVRKLIINLEDLPEDFGTQDIIDYILALPESERTIAETDSKWNVIIEGGENTIFLIYELQNVGKGIIEELDEYENLLELYDREDFNFYPSNYDLEEFGNNGADPYVHQSELSSKTPLSRTIDINGVIQDLSADRQWRAGLSNTGALTYAGISVASATQVNIGAVTGIITNNETTPGTPSYVLVTYAGGTNITVPTIGSGTGTYVLLNSAGTIVFQNTFPTSAQRKAMIYLSKISHPNLSSISFAIDEPDYVTSPLQQHRDLFQAIQYMNQGIIASGNTGLTINTTNGVILGDGINFVLDKTNPNSVAIPAGAPRNFLLLNQSGAVGSFVTTIDPLNYDVAGTTTLIGGGTNRSTIQYLYYAPGVGFAIQRGQTVYSSLTDAVTALGRESFVIRPNLVNNSILIAAICLRHTTTNMNDTAFCRILPADKFGQIGGAAAGVSVTSLQTAYNNSLIPQITVTDSLGAVTERSARALNTSTVHEWQNIAGSTTASVNGLGEFTGTRYTIPGGTASQFLKADGSVDSTSYQTSLGYTPENVANKSDSYTVSSSTTYASSTALVGGLGTKVNIGSNLSTLPDSFLEINANGTGSALHLVNGTSFSAPYILGIGKDNPGTGMELPNKASGMMISGTQRATVTGSDSYWMKAVQLNTVAPLVRLEQVADNSAPLLQIVALGTVPTPEQHLLYIGDASGEAGKIFTGSGKFRWQRNFDIMDKDGSTVSKLRLMTDNSYPLNRQSIFSADKAGLEWFSWAGSDGLWYPFAIKTDGNILKFFTKNLSSDTTTTANDLAMSIQGVNVAVAGNLSASTYSGGASLTGTPTAPTAPAGTNTTQIATTAFVLANAGTSGSFTPTLNNTTNINSSSLTNAVYTRVGNIVNVRMSYTINATAINTPSLLTASLPINRTLSDVFPVGNGVMVRGSGENIYSSTIVQTKNNTTDVEIIFYPTTLSTMVCSVSYSYSILD